MFVGQLTISDVISEALICNELGYSWKYIDDLRNARSFSQSDMSVWKVIDYDRNFGRKHVSLGICEAGQVF